MIPSQLGYLMWLQTMNEWKLAEAKNQLSEVVSRALAKSPQRITRRRDAVVVVRESDYRRLTGERRGFIEYLMDGPSLEGVDIRRDRTPMRDVDL